MCSDVECTIFLFINRLPYLLTYIFNPKQISEDERKFVPFEMVREIGQAGMNSGGKTLGTKVGGKVSITQMVHKRVALDMVRE